MQSFFINDLNEDVLSIIFAFLDISKRVECELVCKKWRNLIHKLPIRCVRICTEDQLRPVNRICKTIAHSVSQLDTIKVPEKRLKQTVAGLFAKYKLINCLYLQFHDIRSLRKQEFFAFMKKFTSQLSHCELDFTYGPFVKEDLMHMIRSWTSTLVHLVIRYRRDRGKILTEKCIMKLLEPCINLELMCWDSPEIVQQRFEYFPQQLHEFYIPSNNLSIVSLEMLAANNGSIFDRLQIGSVNMKHLKIICEQMNFLRTLSLNTIDVEDTSDLLVLKHLHNLEVLEFTLGGQHIDEELSEIAANCARLKKLYLQEVSVSDRVCDVLSQHCQDLHFLHLAPPINSDFVITDLGIERLISLKKLQHLCLPMQRVSAKLMCRLLEQPSMASVDIRGFVDYEQTLVELLSDKARANPSCLYKIFFFRASLECPSGNEELPSNLHITRSIRLVDDSYEKFIKETNLAITD